MLSGDSIFILQSLTTSKMRKIPTISVSAPQSKNLLDLKLVVLGNYEQLLRGGFFYVFGGKKIFFQNILATALKSYIK